MDASIEIHCPENDRRLPLLRAVIRDGMREAGLLPSWNEYDSEKPARIILNNKVIWDGGKTNAITKEIIYDRLVNTGLKYNRAWFFRVARKNLSFLLALFVAFFPKCPFCWAAYLSAFGVISANTLPYRWWYLPLSISLLLLNILVIYLSGKKHQYKPLLLTIAGAMCIISNRIWFDLPILIYTGMILLVAGAAWNSLTKLMSLSLRNFVFPGRSAGSH